MAKPVLGPDDAYHVVVQTVARPRLEGPTREHLDALGLHLLHVTWEDTARFKNSAVGPNISDMTIQVQSRSGGRPYLTCMPVVRFPNFHDRSGDLPIELVRLLVGNERGGPLRAVGLREYLFDLRRYLSRPDQWAGEARSLLSPRDTHVLVSAQACLLPVPRGGVATFTPVLFNYPSRLGNPGVLAILATREGTSATVIDNQRDAVAFAGARGQRLLFNQAGARAPFTGRRESEAGRWQGGGAGGDGPDAARAVLLIQVPLRQRQEKREQHFDYLEMERACTNLEPAVIGHGEVEGPFTEIDNLPIVRDERFPIRVTVQFYKATSDGVLDEDTIVDMGAQLERVLSDATAVGSLVDVGETGRATEWDDGGAGKQEPPGWWADFWSTYAAEHGISVAEARQRWFRGQVP